MISQSQRNFGSTGGKPMIFVPAPTVEQEKGNNMNAEIYTVNEVTVAKLIGTLDSSSAAQTLKQLLPIARSCSKLIIDMSKVDFTFSAGIIMINSTHREITNHGGHMILVGINHDVERTLEITGTLHNFRIYCTLEEGLIAMTL
jgi:anti-sigma B factor antagonist